MIAVDANILVYANRAEFPLHTVARTRLTELAEGAVPWGLPVAAAWGFVRIVTQQIFDPPTPIGQTVGFIDHLLGSPTVRPFSARVRGIGNCSGRSSTKVRVRGGLATGAVIVALCREHGVDTVLSNDRDFDRFPRRQGRAAQFLTGRSSINRVAVAGGRYWDRTSDLFGVNCRRWSLLRSFTHVKRSRGWCCGPLGAPRLLYFAAVPLWTAAGGGLPCAVCGDQAQTPGVVLDEGKYYVRTRSFGRTVTCRQSRSLRGDGDGDGDRLGGDLLLRDRLARVAQVIKIETDRLLGVLDALDHAFPFGNAPRQGGHRDGVAAVLGVGVGVEQDRVGRHPTHYSRLQQTRKLIARDLCGLEDCRERLRLENPAGVNRDHNSRSGPLGVNQDHVGTRLTARGPPARCSARSRSALVTRGARGMWAHGTEPRGLSPPGPDRVWQLRDGTPGGLVTAVCARSTASRPAVWSPVPRAWWPRWC